MSSSQSIAQSPSHQNSYILWHINPKRKLVIKLAEECGLRVTALINENSSEMCMLNVGNKWKYDFLSQQVNYYIFTYKKNIYILKLNIPF